MTSEAFLLDLDDHEEAFKEHYAKELPILLSAEKAFRNLVSQLMDGDQAFEKPKTTSRVKDRDECIRKFKRKYLKRAVDEEDFFIRSYISDMIGIRVICLYETDIPLIEEVIREEFDVFDETNKMEILQKDIMSFGYKAKHFNVKFRADRLMLSEYARFRDLTAEIQLRSIVQDAWSEVEHKLRYKKHAPDFIVRRIACLAALFDLADREFASLHSETERALAAAKESLPTANKLDVFSFLSILESMHPKYTFEDDKIERLFDEVYKMRPDLSVHEFGDMVTRNVEIVRQYRSYLRQNEPTISASFNPYAEVRHILYLADRAKFHSILFEKQRQSFSAWLSRAEQRRPSDVFHDTRSGDTMRLLSRLHVE